MGWSWVGLSGPEVGFWLGDWNAVDELDHIFLAGLLAAIWEGGSTNTGKKGGSYELVCGIVVSHINERRRACLLLINPGYDRNSSHVICPDTEECKVIFWSVSPRL